MFVSRHITIARHVLVADDDETDVYLLRHAFRKAGLLHTLVHVHDGQEVIDYLSKAKEPQPKLPDLVLLDLKMPRLNGFDVLTWLSARKDTISLPVVVLSTSSLSVDRERAKRLGAHDYLVKPNNFEELTTLAKGLDERWFQPS